MRTVCIRPGEHYWMFEPTKAILGMLAENPPTSPDSDSATVRVVVIPDEMMPMEPREAIERMEAGERRPIARRGACPSPGLRGRSGI